MNIRKKVSWPKEPKKKTVKEQAHKPSKKAAPKYEVLTDGKTVWVNNPTCVARFCKVSYEYADSFGFNTVAFVGTHRLAYDWAHFVILVKERFGIQIEDKYRPAYVPIIPTRKLTKAEWALLEVTEGLAYGDDLYWLTGMSIAEGDAILAYVARLKAEHGVEWKNSDYVDMMSNPD
jgi:hypothetical protein